jgi:hypothetical protein
MKKSSFLALALTMLLGACSSSSDDPETSESEVSGVPIGEVRGVDDVSKTLRLRVLDGTDASTPSFDVSRLAGDSVFRMRRHFGVWVQNGTQTEYQGGTATPFSMMLWHQALGRLASALAETCATPGTSISFATFSNGFASTPQTFSLRADVADRVAAACTFTGDEAARRTIAGALFDTLMGRGGSLAEEKAAYLATFAADASTFVGAAPADRVRSMVLVLLLNPHFLLSK